MSGRYRPGSIVLDLIDRDRGGRGGVAKEPVPSVDPPEWPAEEQQPLPDGCLDVQGLLPLAFGSRQADRFFGTRPATLAEVATMLTFSSDQDAARWGSLGCRPGSFSLLLWSWNVEGLEPGLYRYDRAGHHLVTVALAPDADPEELLLQVEFARSAGILLSVCSLAELVARHGAHGHRLALMRGAHALEHAWLAAEASGLCGSIFAGFIPSALRDFVDVDGLTRMTCLAFAFGSRPT